jgi:hypothetical protein
MGGWRVAGSFLLINSSWTEQAYDTAMAGVESVVEFDELDGFDHGRADRRSLPTGGGAERLNGSMMALIMNG